MNRPVTDQHFASLVHGALPADEAACVATYLQDLVQAAADNAANDDEPYGREAHLRGRMSALSVCDSLIRWTSGLELEVLVREELRAFEFGYATNIVVEGPPVRLRPDTGRFISLALHELTTNSIKFGMLGSLRGTARLHIGWTLQGDGLTLTWREEAVPVLAPLDARRKGFGQTFIQDILPRQLGSVCTFALLPGGVRCTLRLPASAFSE